MEAGRGEDRRRRSHLDYDLSSNGGLVRDLDEREVGSSAGDLSNGVGGRSRHSESVWGEEETRPRTSSFGDDCLHLHSSPSSSPRVFSTMVHLVARWTPLTASPASVALSPALIRSSHSLAIIGSDAYVFGGELVPRTPVSADLTIISLRGEHLASWGLLQSSR